MNDDDLTSPDNSGQQNPQLAAEVSALQAEAASDAGQQAEAAASPAGQWEAALLDILPPVFEFADPANELEMSGRDYKMLAKGVSPALAKHFPDMQNFLQDIPVELSAALAVGMVMLPKIRRAKAKRAEAEAAKPKEVKGDASESA